jgi:hypothetical protein
MDSDQTAAQTPALREAAALLKLLDSDRVAGLQALIRAAQSDEPGSRERLALFLATAEGRA